MAFFGGCFFLGGEAFGNLGVHSAVGEGAGVEDKEVLGGFWEGGFVWLFYWVIWVHQFLRDHKISIL